MHILLDLQGVQTESKSRGIGRYSLSLALAMVRHAENHQISILLNGMFPQQALKMREKFSGLVSPQNIHVFDLMLPVAEIMEAGVKYAKIAEKAREYFIQELHPDVVLLSSLFEGYVDNAVTSIGALNGSIPTAVILYDLIPYLDSTIYLKAASQKAHYERKIESLKRADLLLAISEYSRQISMQHLAFPAGRVVNISSAVDDFFKPNLDRASAKKTVKRYGLSDNFILYVPGGFDERKNFERLFKAYELIPANLRNQYPLAIASKIDEASRSRLESISGAVGLPKDAIRLLGYVPDEDLLDLYTVTTVFIFPSLSEGFGLPLLEAMACGAPIIASNSSSIPEIVSNLEALFDPKDTKAIATLLQRVLEDESFRYRLQQNNMKQREQFSWERSAKLALSAIEKLLENGPATITEREVLEGIENGKPKLAFVSPLPPERTGIADYSAELLPALMNYYDIELITDQPKVELPIALDLLPRKSVKEFLKQVKHYDRILYQIGNSYFHSHMLPLLKEHPGVVVLHDFFLSGLFCYEQMSGKQPNAWFETLYYSHGYEAIRSAFEGDMIATKNAYPCNLSVLQDASKGVIVHSNYAKQLADQWYGTGTSTHWTKIPLLRALPVSLDRASARKALGLSQEAFIVCSFGLLDPTKQNHRLLQAWLNSELKNHKSCELVFVGANHGGGYGVDLAKEANNSEGRIRISGWVKKDIYELYLQAADVGVQLRTMSRGETSAAVLDGLNYGLALIVNANGSIAELPSEAAWILPDEFEDSSLVTALETLWKDPEKRQRFSENAQKLVKTTHHPEVCARRYAEMIEKTYQGIHTDRRELFRQLVSIEGFLIKTQHLKEIAQGIAPVCLPKPKQRQLLIDVSSIVLNDLKTGIERVVRAQVLELVKQSLSGLRIEPVYLSQEGGEWHYRYAHQYTLKLLGIPASFSLEDMPIDVGTGDIFYAADFSPYSTITAAKEGLFLKWRALGVSINILVYDLLPIQKPEFFPRGAEAVHTEWLKMLSRTADQFIGISQSVTEDLYRWLEQEQPERSRPLKLNAAPLGADLEASLPSQGLSEENSKILEQLKGEMIFLMVGTIEPRKGHLQSLSAFEHLWNEGQNLKLVIVGREGWTSLPDSERRTIPEIVRRLKSHPELNRRLFWLENVSDECLKRLYEISTCLLCSSEGEGFGLPLIEAARYQLPIIARDLPVFREVAKEGAYYFEGIKSKHLAQAIIEWLKLNRSKQIPSSSVIHWNTWAENTTQVINALFAGN